MKLECIWTIGGDFLVVDSDDDGAPVAELRLHEPLKSMAIDNAAQVAANILQAMIETPHHYAGDRQNGHGFTERRFVSTVEVCSSGSE